jgi:hypothetical protein
MMIGETNTLEEKGKQRNEKKELRWGEGRWEVGRGDSIEILHARGSHRRQLTLLTS